MRVKNAAGRLFYIEVQIEKDLMNERGFFYDGRIAGDAFSYGTSCNKIPQVRLINLADFYVTKGGKRLVEPVCMTYVNHPDNWKQDTHHRDTMDEKKASAACTASGESGCTGSRLSSISRMRTATAP